MIAAHLHEPVPPPRGVRADLEAVLLRCLEKDPARRFASADEVERALAGCGCAGEWDERQAVGWWREYRERVVE